MTTGLDERFENLVDEFSEVVEADENKNVDEQDTDEGKNPVQGDNEAAQIKKLSEEEGEVENEEGNRGKFYPHDMAVSRRESADRRQKAGVQSRIPVLAEYQILHLVDISERGLPDCYDSFKDFLFDFWPDFSWKKEQSDPEVRAVLDDPRFKEIVPVLKNTWGVDMEEELQKGLEFDPEADYQETPSEGPESPEDRVPVESKDGTDENIEEKRSPASLIAAAEGYEKKAKDLRKQAKEWEEDLKAEKEEKEKKKAAAKKD